MVYQLKTKKNSSNFLKNSNDTKKEEKSDSNLYLKNSHWRFLDRLAEEKGVSRNQVAREIMDSVMKESDTDV